MKDWRYHVAAMLAAVTIIGCSTLVTDAVLNGRIAVRVVSRQGVPISDARVLLFRGDRQMEYTFTDSLGQVLFRDVPRGIYGVFVVLQDPIRGLGTIGAPSEGNLQTPIEVMGGEEIPVDFTLLKVGTGVFEARVVDDDSLPIANVEVVAYGPSAEIGVKRTNANGIARFEAIPFGAFGAYAIVPESIGGPSHPPINRQGMFFDAGHFERRIYPVVRCRGTIVTRVLDQSAMPVAAYSVSLFTSTTFQRRVVSDAAGDAVFTQVGCGDYFVSADPNPGFSVTYTRGLGFQDGLRITSGVSLTPVLRVDRQP